MARKQRLEYGGACYHVINRGNYRKNLFAAEGAAKAFVRCLHETCERFGWRLHAYVVMRNHFHLAVETPEPNLSVGMKWLQGTWVARFNRFRGETGRPFQGRFKALHVEPGHALAQVAHYIHLNPVRAKAVLIERLADFPWSSLVEFGRKGRPKWLEAATVLGESGGLADTPRGWQQYHDYLDVLAEEDAKRRDGKFGRLSRGWAIGTGEFKAGLKKEFSAAAGGGAHVELLGADREAHRQIREEIWEDKLATAAAAFGVRLDRLPAQRSAVDKVRLAAVMKQGTAASNGWLAERLKMGQPGSVSQYVRRLKLAGGTDTTGYKRALSKVQI